MKPQFTVWVSTLSPGDPGDWQGTYDTAVAADRAGADRVALTGEHVLFGEHLEAYADPSLGGREGSKQATGPDGHYLEPIVTMSMIAAMTKRVRFVPNIMLVALRRPVVLAKMASTLDVLSGGRLDLGVGVGWQREEYEASGLSFEARGRLLDHSLEVCEALWREKRADYASPELEFSGIHMMPKPVQPGGVPLWISGTVSKPAMRRLARFGAGWIPWGEAAEGGDGLIAAIEPMREMVASFGRDPSGIQVAGHLPVVRDGQGQPDIAATMAKVQVMAQAGVTDFRAGLPVPRGIAAAEEYLSPWVAAFREATA
jgi:probable F420-dependent oxidoreductase